MDYMPRSKDRSRGELEKLRGLSFKEKLEYIWSYYNYHIIGTVVGTALIISIARSCYFKPDTVLFIAWESPYVYSDELEAFNDALSGRIIDPQRNEIAEAYFFFTLTDDPTEATLQYERLLAMLSAGAIDIFVLDTDAMEAFAVFEYIMPLDDILNEIKLRSPALYERISEETAAAFYGMEYDIITGEPLGILPAEETVGIRINDSPMLRELSIILDEDAYLCVAISTENYYNAIQAIIEIFT